MKLAWDIFSTFFKIGLFTLGGGLAIVPFIQQEMLARGWLTNAQFLDILGIAQMTPGPIGVNAATFVGYRAAESLNLGWKMAIFISLVATLGVTLPSIIGVHVGGTWFSRNRSRPAVISVFAVLRPLVAGLVCAAGGELAFEAFHTTNKGFSLSLFVQALFVFALTAYLSYSGKKSPLWGLLLGGILGGISCYLQ